MMAQQAAALKKTMDCTPRECIIEWCNARHTNILLIAWIAMSIIGGTAWLVALSRKSHVARTPLTFAFLWLILVVITSIVLPLMLVAWPILGIVGITILIVASVLQGCFGINMLMEFIHRLDRWVDDDDENDLCLRNEEGLSTRW